MKPNEAKLLIIGEITSHVKKLFIEQLKTLRSRGFNKISLHIFSSEIPLKYLEELREPLLDNMITSIRLYEHNLNELTNWLKQSLDVHEDVIVIADEERLDHGVIDMINKLKTFNKA